MGSLLSLFSHEKHFSGYEKSLERIEARVKKADVRDHPRCCPSMLCSAVQLGSW
jgi:hypothetical protein